MKCECVTLDVKGEIKVEWYDGIKDIYAIIGRGCDTFEVLPCPELPCQVFLDENGKLNGQPRNPYASIYLRGTSSIFQRDHICGKIMFVGPPDDEGEATDVNPGVEKVVRHFVATEAFG